MESEQSVAKTSICLVFAENYYRYVLIVLTDMVQAVSRHHYFVLATVASTYHQL